MKLIEFFLHNRQLNYVLLAFLLVMGVHAYVNIPKEMFPELALNEIEISGSYSGASATTLDKMAVRDIEDGIASVSGIRETETTITPGRFEIDLTLSDNADPATTLDRVKDAIASIRRNLPSDMTEPTATMEIRSKDLIQLSVGSNALDYGTLNQVAEELKNKLAKMAHVAEVDVRGGADERVEIRLDNRALEALGLNPSAAASAVANLSYVFPVGEIEERGRFIYLSTVHGKGNEGGWREARVEIGGRYVRLGEIAQVKIYRAQEDSRASFNGKPNLTLRIAKDEEGNAIRMVKEIRAWVEKIRPNYPEVELEFFYDSSVPLKNRLDTIMSNLALGLILVFLTMHYLINFRTAVIVTIGVPFSFMIGLLFIYYAGYSLNLVSLLGALIVIGIVVDDAIVVSENIQRHLDEGMEKTAAVLAGAKEMFLPVTMATLTTAIAFLPVLTLSAEIGRFIFLIPVVVILVILGSLLESFLFLPLHAQEVLKPGIPSRDWTPVTHLYEKVLHRLIRHKYVSLFLFLVLIPAATVVTAKSMNFQFFPRFDGSFVYISGKLAESTTIEETEEAVREIERTIWDKKEELFVRAVSTSIGWRRNLVSERERGENVFYITLELEEMVEENWVNRYLNPILALSFRFDDPDKVRTVRSNRAAREINKALAPLKEHLGWQELGVFSDRPGLLKSDIKINLVSDDDALLEETINGLQAKLEAMEGVHSVGNNVKYGKEEFKIRINRYGEELGLTEAGVAKVLKNYFLSRRLSTTFNKEGVVEVITEAAGKDDLETLRRFNVPLDGGRYVQLREVADFVIIRDYEKLEKVDGEIIKTVYANVTPKIVTAGEVLDRLAPVFAELEEKGVTIRLKGEAEKNKQLKDEMSMAVVIALFLMLSALLLIFPKIKYALMILSVIPFSILGALLGHMVMGMNLTMPSVIGMLGLAGVVINDGIIMLDFLKGTHDTDAFYRRAKLRVRPILITTVTTFVGLATLIFYATGQAVILQPLAVSLGFGLVWGTVLNLFYLPTLYAVINNIAPERTPK